MGEAVLLVDKAENADSTRFYMFVRARDRQREMWDGKRVGAEGAHQYGADHALELKDYSLRSLIQERAARKSLVLVDKPPKLMLTEAILPPGIPIQDAKSLVESLRFVKSKREMQLAQAAADISEKGFRAIMRGSHPGVNEHVLSAQLEWECRRHGAQRLAYPPVVAGGERANTLHYITNDLPIRDGEMVLVDGGCELFCFSSDVSRTWPVNGKFTPAQKEVYSAVLDAEKQCIQACAKGKSMSQLHALSIRILSEHLKSLGIMNRHNNDYFRFYPHSIGHYLGMDVHDTSSFTVNQKLQPGNMVTIEPGLYIPKCPHIDPKYHNIGIRIEDNIFVTEDGCVNLTRNIPKEIDEVEAVIQGKE